MSFHSGGIFSNTNSLLFLFLKSLIIYWCYLGIYNNHVHHTLLFSFLLFPSSSSLFFCACAGHENLVILSKRSTLLGCFLGGVNRVGRCPWLSGVRLSPWCRQLLASVLEKLRRRWHLGCGSSDPTVCASALLSFGSPQYMRPLPSSKVARLACHALGRWGSIGSQLSWTIRAPDQGEQHMRHQPCQKNDRFH